MPTAQLVSAGIEKAINHLLSLDSEAQQNLSVMSGKQLKIVLQELPWPLVFAFSDRIDVLVEQTPEPAEDVDCVLSLSLATLQLLQDPSQITQLIKQDKLKLEGDIHVAQGFSNLIKQLDIDWEEQLSRYTGDVIAHSVFSFGKSLLHRVKENSDSLFTTLAEGAIEEKKLAAHAIAVEYFNQQVQDLRADTDRLEARLKILETQAQSKPENYSGAKLDSDIH